MSDECKTKFRIDVEFNFSFKDRNSNFKKALINYYFFAILNPPIILQNICSMEYLVENLKNYLIQ